MKTKLIIVCLLLAGALSSNAQRSISYDMIQRNRNLEVRLTLKDSKTSDPIPWVSVYLIPDGDTTITHFALSDDKGDAVLKEVPTGKYELNAEIIGYKPYKKTYTFKGWEYDAGIIKMEESPEFLDAATISAVGNAISVKKDTIEFNASAFKVGENAMLEDLLKKMPGMEVDDDGTVTLNGEKVDKLTVGGKTFFFNDSKAALKGLPAKIVDKIKVVDKTKDEAAISGIVSKDDKEKVLDVELKEEFQKGWYGNAKIGGGATLTGKDDNDLIDDRRMLYNGNAMVTGYQEKDQVVFIGNAYNATEPGSSMVMYYGGNASADDFNSIGGLDRVAKTGVNYNTERIKGMETNVSVTYGNNGKQAAQNSARTSYQNDGPDLLTDGRYSAEGKQNTLNGTIGISSKSNEKYHFHFRQNIGYTTEDIASTNFSRSTSNNDFINSSSASSRSFSRRISADGMIYGGFKQLGKKNRTLAAHLYYSIAGKDKESKDLSEVLNQTGNTVKDLRYDSDLKSNSISCNLTYSEPLSEKWTIQGSFGSGYSANENSKDATNPDGSYNAYYSSVSDNYYQTNAGAVSVQWKNDTSTVQLGVRADMVKNEVHAISMGNETWTGKGEWLYNWSPYAYYEYEKDGIGMYAGYYGYSGQPSYSQLTPSLDITNPIRISTGNIWLKPSFQHGLYSSISANNRETFSFLSVYLNASLSARSTVYASWIDEGGIRYSVPVNSQKPQTNGSVYVSYNRPLGKERKFTLSLTGNSSYTGNYSYQATRKLEGLDIQSFDYTSFMENFWGDSKGSRFYSGESGFGESRTSTVGWGGSAKLKYSIEKLDISAGGSVSNYISKYSLDPTTDMNTWNNRIFCEVLYQPGKDWEIKSDLTYRFYRGYAPGYGSPEWNWNMSVSKSIKAVTLSLKAADILNQTRALRRSTSAEYTEDIYSNVLGRFVMFSVSFNFGKMNSKKNSNVENAVWNMM